MPGGHSTFFFFLNTFVHIVMYSYYMLAAMGPEMQKFLWWKRYLTMFQMMQFIGIFTHAFQLFFSNPCSYPIVFSYWIGGHGVLFLFLFANFYVRTYKKKDGGGGGKKTVENGKIHHVNGFAKKQQAIEVNSKKEL
jgi:elongation of very long chain fatty acids protein 7